MQQSVCPWLKRASEGKTEKGAPRRSNLFKLRQPNTHKAKEQNNN